MSPQPGFDDDPVHGVNSASASLPATSSGTACGWRMQRMDDDMVVAIPEDLQGTADALGKLDPDAAAAHPSPTNSCHCSKLPWRLDDQVAGWPTGGASCQSPAAATSSSGLMELDNLLVRLGTR